MKKLSVLIISILSVFAIVLLSGIDAKGDSADFFVIGKTWIENHNLSYKENYKVVKETSINNKSYYVINCFSVDCNGIVSNSEDFGFFRQESDKIFKYDEINNNEILFFDFGLSVGDVFHSTTGGQFAIETDIEVIDVYYEIFNGYERKCLAIGDVGDNIVRDVWIEGIGAKEGGISYNYMSHIMGKKRQLESCFLEGKYIYGSAVPWTYIYKYTPLLQEHLVWNYGNESIWLSGEKEIDGKTYKICYCDTDSRKSTEELKPYAYLREEDKRVYLRMPENNVAYDAKQRPLWYGYDKSKVNDDEILIYDFNLEVGDICPNIYHNNDPVYVSEIDYVLVGNQIRKFYILSNSGSYIIEGVGIYGIGTGHMPYPFPARNSTIDALPPDLYVLGQTGGCDILGGTSVSIKFYNYIPFVQEGIVWNYYESIGWDNPPLEYARLTLSGNKEINGKSYKNCWLWYDDCTFSKQKSKLVCYLREENGCVYAIINEDCDTQNMFINYGSVGEEHLIYDFNLNIGDESFMGEISAIEFVVIDGELRKKFKIENAQKEYIEGIGTVGEYSLYFCCPDCLLPTSGYKAPSLNYVSDLDGRVIYADDDDWNGDLCKEGGNAIKSIVDDVSPILIEQKHNSVCVTANGEGKIALSVYDLVGAKVAEANGDGEVSLSTDTLPIGIYIVKATSDNGMETAEKKIVVK